MSEEVELFFEHTILYAKGHYIWGPSTMDDLCHIAQVVGLPYDDKNIFLRLAQLCHKTMARLARHDGTSYAYKLYDLMAFMAKNRGEIIERYAPKTGDGELVFESSHMEMLIEQPIRAMLVTIAQLPLEEEQDEWKVKPNPAILPLTSPLKGGKK